jgi:tetratricopeptide (TPR) repeat protein
MSEQIIGNDRILSTKLLVKAISEGQKYGERFCFILGAGASASSGILTGAELEYRWMLDLDKDPGFKEVHAVAKSLKEKKHLSHDFKEIEEAWNRAKEKRQTVLPSEYYFDIYTLRFYPNYRNGYHYLENLMERSKPSFGYHTLALMLTELSGSNLVITTNFDSLVEDALFLYTDKKPLVINHELLAEFAGDLNIKRPVIAKLHRGIFFDPLNRPEETNGLQGKWKDILEKVFQNYTPVVIGYGGGDSSLMEVLEKRDVAMKNGIYWCYVEKFGIPDEKIQTIVEDKKGYLVRTAGFDAVMLAIGNILFKDKIDPDTTRGTLERRIYTQVDNYEEEYKKLKVELEDVAETETPLNESEEELKENIEKLDERTKRSESERQKLEQMTAWDYYRQGNRYCDSEEYENAIVSYDKAIKQKTDYADAYYNRGVTYGKLGESEKAIADYSKAIELKPDYAKAYNNRGCTYDDLGESEKAIADYSKAIELKSDYADAYNNRGNAYNCIGESEKAIADYSKAIELKPDYAVAYNNRGTIYSRIGESEKAIADYSKAIELKPGYAEAYYNRGVIYAGLGESEKAIADYSKVIELNPKDKEAYEARAKVYYSLGEEEKAAADEEAASKL